MVTAIVLVRAEIQRIPEVAETIAQIPEVSEVYSVTGEFDLVAMVRVRAHDELADVIPGKLNKVPGVTHTETHIAFRTYSRHDLDAAFSLGLTAEARHRAPHRPLRRRRPGPGRTRPRGRAGNRCGTRYASRCASHRGPGLSARG